VPLYHRPRLVAAVACAARHPETRDAQNPRRCAGVAWSSPKEHRDKDTWQHVAKTLNEAARGGDPIDVAAAPRMVLSMEGITTRPK
jgi:hypothetical protein